MRASIKTSKNNLFVSRVKLIKKKKKKIHILYTASINNVSWSNEKSKDIYKLLRWTLCKCWKGETYIGSLDAWPACRLLAIFFSSRRATESEWSIHGNVAERPAYTRRNAVSKPTTPLCTLVFRIRKDVHT